MTPHFPTPVEFVRHFADSALRTVRLVRVFGEEDMDLRPGEGSMSTAEQIAHICGSRNFLRGVLEDASPGVELFSRRYDVGSAEAAIRSLGVALEEVVRAAESVTADRWAQEIEPFGPDWRMMRGQMAYLMMDHETHHRGQLHVYARVAGKVPPVLYAPVDEQALRGIKN